MSRRGILHAHVGRYQSCVRGLLGGGEEEGSRVSALLNLIEFRNHSPV